MMTILESLMQFRPNEIHFEMQNPCGGGIFQELFDHPAYLASDADTRTRIALGWAQELYDLEVAHPLDKQFAGVDLASYCTGAVMLDIGCYIGGRTVRWLEKYQGKMIYGVDVDPRYAPVANRFARQKGANAQFQVGFGEHLEFADEFFDVIITKDTFEHVRDLSLVLQQCQRVLKKGGYMIVSFPAFYGPVSHHLDLVTRTPCLHWFFSYPTLLKSYLSIIDQRGNRAIWYKRKSQEPLPFEKGYTINGTTAAQFRRLIAGKWSIVFDGFSDKKSQSKQPVKRLLINALKTVDIPVFRELSDIVYVLKKVD